MCVCAGQLTECVLLRLERRFFKDAKAKGWDFCKDFNNKSQKNSIFIALCVCVCVSETERDRETERAKEKRERVRY